MAIFILGALLLFICGSTHSKPFNGEVAFSANLDLSHLLASHYGFNPYMINPYGSVSQTPSPPTMGTPVPPVGTTIPTQPPVVTQPPMTPAPTMTPGPVVTQPPMTPAPTMTPAPVTTAPPTGPGCQANGYFLPDPTNPCYYIECVILSEPWQDTNGNIPLDMITRQCAPGTGVSPSFTGGVYNPCTSLIQQCTPPPSTATPAPMTAAPMTPAPMTPAPMTAAPMTPVPMTPAPMTPAPMTPAPMTPVPMTPAPMTPAPTGGMTYPPFSHFPHVIPIYAYNPYQSLFGGFGNNIHSGYGRK